MPRIDDDLLNCVIYLYPSEQDAVAGTAAGGSGVLGGVEVGNGDGSKGNPHRLFVVTNKHVRATGNLFARLNTKNGEVSVVDLASERWFDHPDGDDLTVCPINLQPEVHKVHFITEARWVDKAFMTDMDIGLGEDVFSVGRVIGVDGKSLNTPTVRFGNIAQLPLSAIEADGKQQDCFLVEMRSLPGFSGSPVFVEVAKYVHFPGSDKFKLAKYGGIRIVAANILLGLDFCHVTRSEKVIEKNNPDNPNGATSFYINTNSGIAGVIPAWKIDDILVRTEFRQQIEEAKALVKAEDSQAVI